MLMMLGAGLAVPSNSCNIETADAHDARCKVGATSNSCKTEAADAHDALRRCNAGAADVHDVQCFPRSETRQHLGS